MLKVQFKPRLFPSEFFLLSATLSFSLTVDISTFCCTTKRSSPSIPLFSNSGSLLSCATKRTRSRKNRWNHFRLPSQHFRPISSCPPSFPPPSLPPASVCFCSQIEQLWIAIYRRDTAAPAPVDNELQFTLHMDTVRPPIHYAFLAARRKVSRGQNDLIHDQLTFLP